MINYDSYIKKWDEYDCAQHVEPFLNEISPILNNYYKNNPVVYIDIGANVGKLYDLIKQKNVLNLETSYLFEASTRLYDYMKKKYKNNTDVYIFNDIVLDQNINVNFDDSYIDYHILNNDTYINFGISEINSYKNIDTRETKQISKFLQKYKLLNKNVFIKIDTKNSDFLILKDILSIINEFHNKPIIEFEINYTAGGHTAEFAQSILDEYTEKYNYKKIDLNNIRGDGLLVPENNVIHSTPNTFTASDVEKKVSHNIISENNIGLYGSHNGGLAFKCKDGTYRVIEIERFINKKNYGLTQYLLCNHNKFILQEMLTYINQHFSIDLNFDTVIYANTDVIYGEEYLHYEKFINAKKHVNCLHHHAHAAGTFYQSPFNEAIIISYDGGGSDGFFNVFHATRDNSVKNIKRIEIDFGFAYMSFGHFLSPIKFESELGMGNLVYSGKLMGLCGYGEVNKERLPYFKEYYYSKPDGGDYLAKINDIVGSNIGVTFNTNNRLDGEVALNIAATSQAAFEEVFFELITPIVSEYPDYPICLTGGCALNVVCNTRVKERFNRLTFVAPNSNDCGLALGMLLDYEKPKYQVDVTYGGLEILDPYVLYEVIENNHSEKYTHKKAAKLLNDGNIVGLIRGSSEHGPRALGNRSILCNPAIPNMKDILNEKVKKREWFRPFAPIVRLEDVNKYFEFDGESRFMSYYAKVRPEFKEQLISITHIDGTARLQTVTREQNSFIYDLLTEFDSVSGIGVLLNTSFNVNGKPLINTYKDAIYMLKNSGLDNLFTEQYIVHKL